MQRPVDQDRRADAGADEDERAGVVPARRPLPVLAEQRQGDETMTPSNAMRLRLATVAQPDAELPSNQELASVYLKEPENPVAEQAPEPEPSAYAALLEGLGLADLVGRLRSDEDHAGWGAEAGELDFF